MLIQMPNTDVSSYASVVEIWFRLLGLVRMSGFGTDVLQVCGCGTGV